MGDVLNVFGNLQNTVVNLRLSLKMDENVLIIPLNKIFISRSVKCVFYLMHHAKHSASPISHCNATGNCRNC